jgi:hypothetical protein
MTAIMSTQHSKQTIMPTISLLLISVITFLSYIVNHTEGFIQTTNQMQAIFSRRSIRAFNNFPSRSQISAMNPQSSQFGSFQKVYTDFAIYKGKAALCVKVIPPTYRAGQGFKNLEREGAFLLEFAPADSAPKVYDWNQKLTISLNPIELGELLVIDGSKGAEFFHDPNLGGNFNLYF